MGANMAQRLLRGGHRVVGFDPAEAARGLIEEKGAESAVSLEALVAKLKAPRVLWLMVPAGAITDATIDALTPLLAAGDTLIDGGNSNYRDTQRRAQALAPRQIHYVDSGTSGGIWGLAEGYSLMIGGDEKVVERLRPIFATLAPAPDKGWGRVGEVGSGHYTKMIHNGIEYGLMQAYAEGFSILQHKSEFKLDLHQIAEIWRYGSVMPWCCARLHGRHERLATHCLNLAGHAVYQPRIRSPRRGSEGVSLCVRHGRITVAHGAMGARRCGTAHERQRTGKGRRSYHR